MLKYIRFKLFYGIESVIRRRHIFRELNPRRKLLGVVEYADIYCVPRSSNDVQCDYLRATRFCSMTECLIKTKNYQCVNYFMLQFSCACTCTNANRNQKFALIVCSRVFLGCVIRLILFPWLEGFAWPVKIDFILLNVIETRVLRKIDWRLKTSDVASLYRITVTSLKAPVTVYIDRDLGLRHAVWSLNLAFCFFKHSFKREWFDQVSSRSSRKNNISVSLIRRLMPALIDAKKLLNVEKRFRYSQ